MEKYKDILKASELFTGLRQDEILSMVKCLDGRLVNCKKGEHILSQGDSIESISLLLSGKVHIESTDFWGGRNILSVIRKGEIFAEAYAFDRAKAINDVIAAEDSTVLLLNAGKVLRTCSSSCPFHSTLIDNLFNILARKNRLLVQKISQVTKRSTREKVLSYLSDQAKREGCASFSIPFDRQALADYLVLPEGVTIEQTGEMSDFSEFGPTLIMIVLLALFLVYAVMAAQFESLIDPLIIFVTIPLLLIGVIWIHIIYGADFTLFSIVGIVALIGVVVNNGIVLIDCINRLVRQKVPVREACLQAARGRLRPILMTTLTTILGLIPMAFFPGEGTEMMQPIALTFVGGITTGAFLTLLLSPVLYSLFNTRREKRFDDPESLNNQLFEYDMRRLKHIDSEL